MQARSARNRRQAGISRREAGFPRREAGFSGAELMVVVALIGMMVLISTPSMITFWNSMKVRTAAHRLMSHSRLCRQVAVSRRAPVLMQLQRTTASVRPVYRAWEERANDLVRDANGVDNVVNNVDDENWVVRDDNTMGTEGVKFVDCYNDITPTDATDDPGASIMNTDGVMYLKFYPNGQVLRINDDNDEERDDVQIRMRLRRKVTGSRADQWDVTLNRVGKVGYDVQHVPPTD